MDTFSQMEGRRLRITVRWVRRGSSGQGSHSPDGSNWERPHRKALQLAAGVWCLLLFLHTAPCQAYSNRIYHLRSQHGIKEQPGVTHTPEARPFSHSSPEMKVSLRNCDCWNGPCGPADRERVTGKWNWLARCHCSCLFPTLLMVWILMEM